MRASVAAAALVAYWSASGETATAGSLAALPLKDRCAVAILIAKEVNEVVEVSSQGGRGLDAGPLRILISRTPDGDEPVSIFAAGEDCGKVTLPLTWTKGGKIDVEFAAGAAKKLDALAHVLVSARPLSASGWEMIWPLDRRYVGCQKVTHPGEPRICFGMSGSSASPWGHFPALRLRISRRGNSSTERHQFQVDEAVLEIVKFT